MRWFNMKQYKLISLVICFVVLIVLSNPLVAQSKYRQANPDAANPDRHCEPGDHQPAEADRQRPGS